MNAIKDFAKEHIPAFREEIKSIKDLDEFLKFNQLPNKLLLFTDKKETPLMFKGMTSIFRDRIDVYYFNFMLQLIIHKVWRNSKRK